MDEEISERTFAPVDLTYGQRSALPDLDDENEDGSVNEALEYLRSVRSQASSIPHLLVSHDWSELQQANSDTNGYYEDGAYTAIASNQDDDEFLDNAMSSNQMACYDVLRSRFSIARSDMNRISPTTSSSVSRSTSQALDFHSNHAQYNHAFLYTFPNAKVIAGTPQCSIVLGLKRYESAMTKRNFMMGETESSNLGAWGWALLARCRPTQQMDGEDIAVVREVGKTAIRLIKKIRRESKDIESSSQQSEHEDDMENGTLDLQTDSHDQEQSVIFALDILVTVIGEEFGQRDLLNSRENW